MALTTNRWIFAAILLTISTAGCERGSPPKVVAPAKPAPLVSGKDSDRRAFVKGTALQVRLSGLKESYHFDTDDMPLAISVTNLSARPVFIDEARLPWEHALSLFLEFPSSERDLHAVYPIEDFVDARWKELGPGEEASGTIKLKGWLSKLANARHNGSAQLRVGVWVSWCDIVLPDLENLRFEKAELGGTVINWK